MKIKCTIFLFLILGICSTTVAQKKAEKNATKQEIKKLETEKTLELFKKTLKLVESNQFQIEINYVYPQDGFDLSRFNPRGNIIIDDSIAKGQLPFFGRAYSLPYGEGGGIEFDNQMQEQKTKVVKKRKKEYIRYSFSVKAKNDTYQFQIDISPNRKCTINLNSNTRAHITYSGDLYPLKEK